MSHAKSNVSIQRNQNQSTNVRVRPNRAKSVDSAQARRHQQKEVPKINTEPRTLEEAGYCFNQNGKLVGIEDERPFEFYVYTNNEDNQRRYHTIGRLVDDYVYKLMETELHLQRFLIPRDPKKSEPTGFFFTSNDALTADYLMIIIHGMGVVRAGQWSRKLIINESLTVGSQFEYIHRAQEQGYGVIVTNTNLNADESSKSFFNSPRPIRGSGSAEEHARYIWENFVRHCSARYICIMAHSYGGAVVLALASKYTSDFDKRVFAVALTDSPMKAYARSASSSVLKMLKKRTINWIADTRIVDTPMGVRDYGEIRSAGHGLHEWTSHVAFEAIFKFFEEERSKLERSKR